MVHTEFCLVLVLMLLLWLLTRHAELRGIQSLLGLVSD